METTVGWVGVQQTADGGYIIFGLSTFGGMCEDIWLIKTDKDGDTLWTKRYGWPGDDYINPGSGKQTQDHGYIIAGGTGWDPYDVFLLKTDSLGNTLWTKTYGGDGADGGRSVQQTTDGGYIIVGETESFGVPFRAIYAIKTDSLGDTLWTKAYWTYEFDHGMSVQQTSDGGYIILGATGWPDRDWIIDVWLIRTDSLGDTIWTRFYDIDQGDHVRTIRITSDHGYIIGGTLENQSLYTWFLAIKTDSLGDTIWVRKYGPINERSWSPYLITTSDSCYLLAGYSRDPWEDDDIYLVKIDPLGNVCWDLKIGNKLARETANSVQQTSDGGYILTGSKNNKVYLIRLSPEIGISEPLREEVFPVATIRPNPFSKSTTVTWVCPQSKRTDITIYNSIGRKVKTIPGGPTIIWDGCDDSGRPLPSGIYFVSSTHHELIKVVKLK